MIDQNHLGNYQIHRRSSSLPSLATISINQSASPDSSLDSVISTKAIDKKTMGNCSSSDLSEETSTIANINDNQRSNFADVMAYSFDFPKLYSHFISNRDHYRSERFVIKKVIRARRPLGNYVCRLCHVSGHWIDQCVLFKPKKGFRIMRIEEMCALCNDPRHSVESCTNFVVHSTNNDIRAQFGVKKFMTSVPIHQNYFQASALDFIHYN